MIIFKKSPSYLEIGHERGRCVLSDVDCKPPYVCWRVSCGGNLCVDGSAVTVDNVCDHVADVIARRGVWAKLDKPEPGLCVDLLALAYAKIGGLIHHSCREQRAGVPKELRAPVKLGVARKPS